MATTDHFSYSQLATFFRCGEQYRRRYTPPYEKIPPGIAAIRGTGCHAARSHNMRQKMESGTDLAVTDLADVAREKVMTQFAGGVWLAPDERDIGEKKLRGKTVDVAVRLAKLDREKLQSAINPIFVEADRDKEGNREMGRITIAHPDLPKPIWVYLDLVGKAIHSGEGGTNYEFHRIHDLKTSTKSPPDDIAHKSSQLTIQHMAWTVGGTLNPDSSAPIETQFDYLIEKANPEAKPYPTVQTRERQVAVLRRLAIAMQCIERGDFPPCDEGYWLCTPKWCGYYPTCGYVIGR